MDIYLKDISIEDSEMIIKWRNDISVKKYFIYQDDISIEDQTRWIKEMVNTGKVIQSIIYLKENDEAIGTVYLRDIDRINKKAEFGIFIGKESERGKGYGGIAAQLMTERAFKVEGLHRVYLRVFADNARAIESYKKAGFQIEGVLKDDVYINGRFRDIIWMARVN